MTRRLSAQPEPPGIPPGGFVFGAGIASGYNFALRPEDKGIKMNVDLLLRGLVIGFSIAAPVGPIGVLCIRRTLAGGRLAGLLSGLGAATADAVYGCIAGFGLSFIASFLVEQQHWLRLLGGLFLCYLGLKNLLMGANTTQWDQQSVTSVVNNGLAAAYLSTFFLTLTNPITIISFAGVFAGMGLASAAGDYVSAGALVLGVFIGSAAWWLLLSGGASLLRNRFSPAGMSWVNRISGLVIIVFGISALLSLLVK